MQSRRGRAGERRGGERKGGEEIGEIWHRDVY